MISKFSIFIKNVRAISEAEIDLNGITVLAGENGCGKTTISKLLYGFIKTSINYDSVVSGLYSKKIYSLYSLLSDFIPSKNIHDSFLNSEGNVDDFILQPSYLNDLQTYLLDVIIPRIKSIRQKYKNGEYSITEIAFLRLLQLYEGLVKRKIEAKNVVEILDDYENYIFKLAQEMKELKVKQNLEIFNLQLSKYFDVNTNKWNYVFKEYGSDLIDKKSQFVTLQKSFSETIYVDVPTLFDNDYSRNSILADLKSTMRHEKGFIENQLISNIIEETLNGKISRKKNLFSQIFVYTTRGGQSIPLSQAASGLKCFAILERLYANGYLNEDTLLILDEPEVHLHPKWIVEYARVLVLIQKYLHTTILIASHNPDMISAIKYISEKEKCSDSLTFYIAEKINNKEFGKYKFKNLGIDIEDIFASFNTALDRISQYGEFNDE